MVQHHLTLEPGPDREGEPSRTAAGEVHQCVGLRHRRGGDHRGRFGPGLDRFHEIAHFLPGHDEALGQKLAVSRFHGDLAHLKVDRQRPFGGELLARCQPSGEDVLPDLAVQGLIQGLSRCFFQFIGQHRLPPAVPEPGPRSPAGDPPPPGRWQVRPASGC